MAEARRARDEAEQREIRYRLEQSRREREMAGEARRRELTEAADLRTFRWAKRAAPEPDARHVRANNPAGPASRRHRPQADDEVARPPAASAEDGSVHVSQFLMAEERASGLPPGELATPAAERAFERAQTSARALGLSPRRTHEATRAAFRFMMREATLTAQTPSPPSPRQAAVARACGDAAAGHARPAPARGGNAAAALGGGRAPRRARVGAARATSAPRLRGGTILQTWPGAVQRDATPASGAGRARPE